MKSKECLERLLKYANINEAELITKYGYSASNDIETIKQDLDRLEKLEKALDKACEKLDYTCIPVEEELVEDLDCDNNCKECWKKYFMKEVSKND